MNIVFFDIDGTLATGLEVPESAQEALRLLRAGGNLSFICTGRPLSYVRNHFSQYADGFICHNGRLAVMNDKVIYDHPMPKDMIAAVTERLDRIGAGYVFFEPECAYYTGEREGFERMQQVWKPGFLKEGFDPEHAKVYNFDVFFRDRAMRDAIEAALSDMCIMNPHGPHPSADMTIIGIDKGSALKAVGEYLNVSPENLYAFGDGMNDICMLDAAGHGIAMGNAMPEVKKHAEYVTEDIDRDGIFLGLKHYGLI